MPTIVNTTLALLFVMGMTGVCHGQVSEKNTATVTRADASKLEPEPVEFESADRVTLVGDWIRPASGRGPWPVVILVHGLGQTQRSFETFLRTLAAQNVCVLAFDLRGHGGSTRQGIRTLDAKRFTPGIDYRAMVNDVEAAILFAAARKEADVGRIALVGASMGANLAAQAVRRVQSTAELEGLRIRAVVLLSPGAVYRGVECQESNVATMGELPLYLCASHEDHYSYESVQSYRPARRINPLAEFYFLEQAGHGTAILDSSLAIRKQIAAWLGKHLQPRKEK